MWRLATGMSAIRARLIFRRGCRGKTNELVVEDKCMIRGLEVEVRGENNLVVFGEGSWLKDLRIVIHGSSNRIIVGRGTEFTGPGRLWVEDDGGELRIGDGCTIEPGATLAVLEGQDLNLGRDCMVAADVEVRTGDSHEILDRTSCGTRLNSGATVKIGDHVWLGKRVVVLKGVEIAPGVVVGVGSIVTSSALEDDSVVAGNPARLIRRGVRWQR
jgi:acetyltransferase-like isoleucine patch superfamily enzyme